MILSDAVEDSFNCISVEGHMSTNDTVLLLASGRTSNDPLRGGDLVAFAALVGESCRDLARMIPDDGEGATHLITIDVEGCRDREQARMIARAVADSPLVKTAVHGADPNWGRIVSAAGYSGVPFEEQELSLWLNGVALYRDGRAPPVRRAPAVSARLRAEPRDARPARPDPRPTRPAACLDVRPRRGRVRPPERRLHDYDRISVRSLGIPLAEACEAIVVRTLAGTRPRGSRSPD